MSALLTLRNVEVRYARDVRALRPTSLAIEEGQFVVLLGPSGAGKSTLLRTLNGLCAVSAGHIEVAGLGELKTSRVLRLHRQRTGMIFQQHHLIGRATALSNVLTGRLGYRSALSSLLPWSLEDKTLALAALERAGLLEHALRRADALSGGQQQRVGIARALVQQPRLLLADEPVASLDPASAERVMSLLREICRSDGLTAVVSLHQVELARRYADRIVGLGGGQVIFDGTPEALTPARVQHLYAEAPPAPAALPAMDGSSLLKLNPVTGPSP